MFLGIFSAILGSASTMFYRLSIGLWTGGRSSFVVLGNWIGMLMALVLLYTQTDWLSHISLLSVAVFAGLAVSIYHNGNRVMEINRSEKLSTLQLFGNISTFITIIAGFFIYGQTSFATLGIVILCGAILFGAQFQGGKFHPPESVVKIITTYTVGAINSLVIVWLIHEFTSVGYFIASSISATVTALIMMIYKGTLPEILSGTKKLYLYRSIDGVMFNSVRYIHFFLIGTLGPVVTTLLGMLGNITTLIFGRIFLGEKNTLREWGVNIVIMILVGIGFYLK